METSWEHLQVNLDEKVLHVSLNRPDKANALNYKLWFEIRELMQWADKNPKVRCVILKATGKNYCAGIDFSMLQELSAKHQAIPEGVRQERLRQTIIDLQDCFSAVEQCRKPVIAAIQGACFGGGIDLITACDMRYCSEDAQFSVKEVDLAIVADIGTLQRLPRIVSEGVARELCMSARVIGSQEAKDIHLVNRVYADYREMEIKVSELAKLISEKSPLAMRGIKQVMNFSRDHSVAEGLDFVANWNAGSLFSDDFARAIEASLQKQKAVFEDS